MKAQQAGHGKRIAAVVSVVLWLLALLVWPATLLIALATGWDTVSSGFLSIHDANAAGLGGFMILTILAFAATVVTTAVAHVCSLTASSTGKRIAFSAAWLTALVVGTLGVFLATEYLAFFVILSFFEGLF